MTNTQYMEAKAAAKVLGIGTRKLNKLLRDNGIYHRDGTLKNTPRAAYIERGLFTTVTGVCYYNDRDHFYIKPLITNVGLSYLRELIDGVEQRQESGNGRDRTLVHPEQHRPQNQQIITAERNSLLRMVGIKEA
ncbi:hypothetical protein G8770_03710 [Aestuariicella hydrocarbonica]|uniref:Antirepressor protein C-terminal domain-containing protein n=1 Tax=Pseudomaricurvus hydrocarbonicus TaxID=1470433 RepID=A0A9E5JYQ4_9GAMM|nr:phage antirepressor KilAC domain-containing protein [Aestuariicella hydrocarbonica]NHO64652.1 hypothetical protein [Aestuariicella hydrocarbonica]